MMKTARIASLVVAALLATAGAAEAGPVEPPFQIGGAYSVRVTSLKEARFARTVRQQTDYSCGAAALATLLTHQYAHPVPEEQVLQEMLRHADAETVRRDGFSMLDMKRYLASEGFEADGFEASVTELAAAGVPAVAMIDQEGYHHFVVIKGVREGRVLVADPAAGLRAMPIAAFEAMRATTILLVIGNRREDAAFNLAADWRHLPRAPLADKVRALADIAPVWRNGSDF